MHWSHFVNALVYALAGFLVAFVAQRALPPRNKDGSPGKRSNAVFYGTAVTVALLMVGLYAFIAWRSNAPRSLPEFDDTTISVDGTVAAAPPPPTAPAAPSTPSPSGA